jgi:hypothetical protein
LHGDAVDLSGFLWASRAGPVHWHFVRRQSDSRWCEEKTAAFQLVCPSLAGSSLAHE